MIGMVQHLHASGAPELFQSFQLFPPGTPLVIDFIVTVVIVNAIVMVTIKIIGFKNKFAELKVYWAYVAIYVG